MTDTTPKHIGVDDCVDGRAYRLKSRNLAVGVYSAEKKGFTGIRTKFGSRFLSTEYHLDLGSPYGTAKPLELLPDLPPEPEKRPDDLAEEDYIGPGKLFTFLDELERKEVLALVVSEMSDAIGQVARWTILSGQDRDMVTLWIGDGGRWRFLVAMGATGTATKHGVTMDLTPELVKVASDAIRKQTGTK